VITPLAAVGCTLAITGGLLLLLDAWKAWHA